jgi:hypothetical protein
MGPCGHDQAAVKTEGIDDLLAQPRASFTPSR